MSYLFYCRFRIREMFLQFLVWGQGVYYKIRFSQLVFINREQKKIGEECQLRLMVEKQVFYMNLGYLKYLN